MRKPLIIVISVLLTGLCLASMLITGMTLWYFLQDDTTQKHSLTSSQPIRNVVTVIKPTNTNTSTPIPTNTPTTTPTDTPTVTPLPTDTTTPTNTPTSIPPTDTPIPPTDTPIPTLPPPTPTDTPTLTPTPQPAYKFKILEQDVFPTNHADFDVYIAITDEDNHPLGNYRVIANHTSGLQVESQVSVDRWSENSGAMWYKGANLKFQFLDSSTGVWNLQLVDEANQPMAPPAELAFDVANPTWYFLLYRSD
jgi:hypothetical protein